MQARLFVLLLLLLFVPTARASDALILIRHDRAGPNLPTADFEFGDWLLWPAEQLPNSENGLLSICSGMDWEGRPADLEFQSAGADRWRSLNWDSLVNRGYLARRKEYLGADLPRLISSGRGTVDPESLIVALGDRPSVVATPFGSHLRDEGWFVYEASNWDEVAHLSKECAGRSLVIEYPPSPGTLWTRFWRFGTGWRDSEFSPEEEDLKVPGLVRMRSLYRLLRRPDEFHWVTNRPKTWGGANRWLLHASQSAPWIGGVFLLLAFASAGFGLYAVAQERVDPLTRSFMFGVLLLPAADELAMNLAFRIGLLGWPIFLVFCELGLLVISLSLSLLLGKWASNLPASSGVFLTGAVVLTFLNPVWSDLSGSFRWPPIDQSPELTGVWIGYLTGVFAMFGSQGRKAGLAGSLVGLALLACSVFLSPWWTAGGPSFISLAVIPWAAGMGLCRHVFLLALFLLPTSVVRLTRGFVWQPYDLIRNLGQVGRFNGAEWVRFGVSPGFLATALCLGTFALLSDRFVWYRVRHSLTEDPRRAAVLWSSAGLASFAILNPGLLAGALVLAIGGGLTLVAEMI